MIKSILEAFKACVRKKEEKEIAECNVEQLVKNVYTNAGTVGSGSHCISLLQQTTMKNLKEGKTFFKSEGDDEKLDKEYKEQNNNYDNYINCNACGCNKFSPVKSANNQNTFRVENSSLAIEAIEEIEAIEAIVEVISDKTSSEVKLPTEYDEETFNRVIQESACFKDFKSTLLFTVKDPYNENDDNEEMTEQVFSMSNIVILDMEIAYARKLTLEDEEGSLLFNQFLVIDASGLVNSLRRRRDGYVFFGPVAEYKNCLINDFVINFSQEFCKTRLFVIFYERNDQKYYIRNINDSGNNILMYVRIIKPYQIRKKTYFNINQVTFSIQPEERNYSTIKIMIYNNNKISNMTISTHREQETSGKTCYVFNKSESPVLIGRVKCSITLDFSFMSKRHCSVVYNAEEECWELSDGFNNRASTNGTWMLMKSKYEVNESEKVYVKVGQNIIKITMV